MKRKLQTSKKILSVLLCALVLFSCVPMSVISASAESASDITVAIDTGAEVTLKDTDADNYYEIGTADELYAFAYAINGGNYSINGELTADIVVNEGTMSAETDSINIRHWTPIGNNNQMYIGNFNGNNHTISGLYFSNIQANYVGLFSSLGENSIVENVGVINSYFNAREYIGSVAGKNFYGTIKNCYNTGIVNGNSRVGGIVGFGLYNRITDSYNSGRISGSGYTGGIAGYASSGAIKNCYNTGKISGGADNVSIGGIAGESDHTFIGNSYNTGEVTGDRCVGGIVGIQQGMLINCYNTGAISGRIITGGIVGSIYLATIRNCYNTGAVTSNTNTSSSVVSLDYDHSEESYSNVTNCYYLADVELDGFSETTFKTKEQFASGEVAYLLQAGVTDTDENGTILESWGQKLGTDAYPLLGGDKVYSIYHSSCVESERDFTNNSDEAVARPVHTFNDECNGFCAVCGESYEEPTLNNNGTDDTADDYYEIDNAGKLYWFAEKVNAGEKTINAQLTADIVVNDGTMTDKNDSTKIRHWISIGNNGNRYEGTFNGNNHTVSGLYLNNNCETNFVGLFSCVYKNGTVENVGVVNSYFNGDWYIGGVAGYNYGTITNSYSTGTVNGNRSVGGVVGYNYEGTITNSYNTGIVNGTDNVGGVVGYIEKGTITNSYNTGTVNGTDNVGGVVGYSPSNSSIKNNYYLNTVCTGAVNGVDVNGATPKTAKQFASGEVACLLQGENAEIIWGQTLGTDKTPTLDGDKVYYVTNCKGENVYSNINADADGHIYNNTHVCKDCYTLEENQIAGVAGYSLSLGGNIALSYHIVLDESVATNQNTKVVFTVPSGDETETVEYSVNDATKNGDLYVFTCEVSAKEMASNIICKVVSGNTVSSTFKYSVKQYADTIVANSEAYNKSIVEIVKTMLNYGAYAQEYFGYNTSNLANANLSDDDKSLADVDLSKYAYTVTGNQEGINVYGATLSLTSENAINLYFEISDEINVETLDVTVDGKPAQLEKSGSYYRIKISNILVQNLGDMYEVKLGNLTVNYGVFSYGNIAMSTDNNALKNVIKAMYSYYMSTIKY